MYIFWRCSACFCAVVVFLKSDVALHSCFIYFSNIAVEVFHTLLNKMRWRNGLGCVGDRWTGARWWAEDTFSALYSLQYAGGGGQRASRQTGVQTYSHVRRRPGTHGYRVGVLRMHLPTPPDKPEYLRCEMHQMWRTAAGAAHFLFFFGMDGIQSNQSVRGCSPSSWPESAPATDKTWWTQRNMSSLQLALAVCLYRMYFSF